MDKQDLMVVKGVILSGRGQLLHTRDGEPSVIDSAELIFFFRRLGIVSEQSGDLSLTNRLEAA